MPARYLSLSTPGPRLVLLFTLRASDRPPLTRRSSEVSWGQSVVISGHSGATWGKNYKMFSLCQWRARLAASWAPHIRTKAFLTRNPRPPGPLEVTDQLRPLGQWSVQSADGCLTTSASSICTNVVMSLVASRLNASSQAAMGLTLDWQNLHCINSAPCFDFFRLQVFGLVTKGHSHPTNSTYLFQLQNCGNAMPTASSLNASSQAVNFRWATPLHTGRTYLPHSCSPLDNTHVLKSKDLLPQLQLKHWLVKWIFFNQG